jgi:uncharacterized membrane protein
MNSAIILIGIITLVSAILAIVALKSKPNHKTH